MKSYFRKLRANQFQYSKCEPNPGDAPEWLPFEVRDSAWASPFGKKVDWGVMVTSRSRSDEIRKCIALKRRSLQAVCCRAFGTESRWSGW